MEPPRPMGEQLEPTAQFFGEQPVAVGRDVYKRQALQTMEDGFSSVMFDGSHYPIEENIEKTKEIICIASEKGISVEAEVGAIGGEEDGVVGGGEVADPEECKKIADLGVTMLAAGIGNIHGRNLCPSE